MFFFIIFYDSKGLSGGDAFALGEGVGEPSECDGADADWYGEDCAYG